MKRQIALLRGINVSGKNKVSMAELKEGFEELGFQEVKTYLNSGNVIFSSDGDDVRSFTNQIEAMIKNQFGLDIPVFVISKEELEDILRNAPDWWGNENTTKKWHSGLSVEKIIKKQIGGQRRQVQVSARN